MKNKVRVIDREDLVNEGIKIITDTDTEEAISLDGLEINQEIKKCFQTILEADTEFKRKEHTRKIEEGMRKKGVKRGRLPLADELIKEIIKLRESGMTYEEVSKGLKEKGKYVSVKTINKYCKRGGNLNE